MATTETITPIDTQSNDVLMHTLLDWASFPGDYVISTLAGMDIGAYLGFVEADVDGWFSIAISVVLTPLIIFLIIYPFKNFIDVILHCMRHELRQDRIKCKTGFMVLALFLIALVVKQYPIVPWIQDVSFGLFIASWIGWFGIGRWWVR
ncbi:hypothetical protein [Candidatus Thioglobus sp.]|uniref:hypothetical protein n=1 Tax=Candidatus Thioglobus sp. TaxID=2026721 RepID=UPI00261F46A6|nr:hypothetical protein [Candidatus Thioglobus sp.]MDG2395931.1 hypothetical protein [Candidatus Thioglobus sp.]